MAIYKCKMCGGALDVHDNETVAVCEYCGSKQTVPTKSSEVITNLFNRANNLRLKNEFDKAAEIYGKILDEDDTNSEAHWCLLLCKYGIEYVEDPKTNKRIPTCHRAQYTSVLTDPDYTAAVENAEAVSKEVYAEQAHEISELQKSILAIVKNEKPFDVFICYKESDENGKRTVDSALANDIYYQLTKEGLRVFYAAITLEDKLGQEYEPYIFAALNTAKVMLVIGTKPEYFEAVWVRNEWSRFLAMMKTDRDKMLIPCYRDMDAYELPEEFAHLQAQDMAKIGFITDLVRGIKKVTAKDEPKTEQSTVIRQVGASSNMQALLKRGYMALEDHEWDRADGFFEEVLNLDAECAEAYLGQLLAKNKLSSLKAYTKRCFDTFCDNVMKNGKTVTKTVPEDDIRNAVEKLSIPHYLMKDEIRKQYGSISVNYKVFYDAAGRQASELKKAWGNDNLLNKAKRFAKGAFADELAKSEKELFDKVEGYLATIKAKDEEAVRNAEEKFSGELAEQQLRTEEYYNSQIKRREMYYADCCKKVETAETIPELNELLEKFALLEGYKDSEKKEEEIWRRIEKIEAEEKAERARKEAEEKARKKAEEEKIQLEKKKFRKKTLIIGSSLAAVIAVVLLLVTVIIPSVKYNKANELMNAGEYEEAISAFKVLDGFKDSEDKILECQYYKANELMNAGEYDRAISVFHDLDGFKDSDDKKMECKYCKANDLMNTGNLDEAYNILKELDNYKDAADKRVDYLNKKMNELNNIKSIAAGGNYTIGLKKDGAVVSVGYDWYNPCDVSSWTDIVTVAAGTSHIVGLKSNGTVEAVGNNDSRQCNVSGWTDIVTVAASHNHTVGLKKDGTVVAVGNNNDGQCKVSGWTDIVAIAAGWRHTIGLKSDGSVVAVGHDGYSQCDVSQWTDIVDVAAGRVHTVGLKKDGTVVAVGDNDYGQCDVLDWTDIVAVVANGDHTVGLKSDGTVVAVGDNEEGQCAVLDWTDIVTVAASYHHTVGLKKDGTVVAVGNNDWSKCEVSDWKDIMIPQQTN